MVLDPAVCCASCDALSSAAGGVPADMASNSPRNTSGHRNVELGHSSYRLRMMSRISSAMLVERDAVR